MINDILWFIAALWRPWSFSAFFILRCIYSLVIVIYVSVFVGVGVGVAVLLKCLCLIVSVSVS
jgi:hypothetical protein